MLKYITLFFTLTAGLNATVVDYTLRGHMTSTSVLPEAFGTGDAFTLSFKLDYGVVDLADGLNDGFFPGALSDLQFSLDAGSIGTYAGGSMSGGQFVQIFDDILGGYDVLAFYVGPIWSVPGLNFPDFANHPFNEFTFVLTSTFNPFTFSSNTGDSLGSIMPPLETINFDNGPYVSISFDGGSQGGISGEIESISVSSVPDTLSCGLWTGLTLLGLVAFRRKLASRLG